MITTEIMRAVNKTIPDVFNAEKMILQSFYNRDKAFTEFYLNYKEGNISAVMEDANKYAGGHISRINMIVEHVDRYLDKLRDGE